MGGGKNEESPTPPCGNEIIIDRSYGIILHQASNVEDHKSSRHSNLDPKNSIENFSSKKKRTQMERIASESGGYRRVPESKI
jgi:hypothetical protein